MKITTPEALAELLAKMTKGRYMVSGNRTSSLAPDIVTDDGAILFHSTHHGTMYVNSEALAALANLSTRLQELWAACEQMKREFMLIDDGFNTGLVPPELVPVCQILQRLANGDADK